MGDKVGASTYSSRNALRLSSDLIRSRNTQSRAMGWREVERAGVIQPVMEEGVRL